MGVNHVNFADGRDVLDLRGDTIIPEVLLKGYTAHDGQGNPIVGTMPLNDLSDPIDTKVALVTCDMDIANVSVNNLSHSYQEIAQLIEQGYIVKIKGDYGIGVCYGELVIYNTYQNMICFQIMMQSNLLGSTQLCYFNLEVWSDRNIVRPYIVTTTGLGG